MKRKILFFCTWPWVLEMAAPLISALEGEGLKTLVLTTEELKRKYSHDRWGWYTPERFGVTDIYKHRIDLLESIYQLSPFRGLVYLNYDDSVKELCCEHGIKTMYMEQGLLRPLKTMQFDYKGLLWTSSIPERFHRWGGGLNTPWLERIRHKMLSTVFYKSDYMSVALRIDPEKLTVFIPLQHEKDSNILLGSPFSTMQDFLNFCERVIDHDKYNIVYKRHPVQKDVAIENSEKYIFADGIPSLDLALAADVILTINSTVGFEGLLFKKKIITLGESAFSCDKVVYRATPAMTSIEDASEFFAGLDPDVLERYVYTVLTENTLPTSQMFANTKPYSHMMFERGPYFEEWTV